MAPALRGASLRLSPLSAVRAKQLIAHGAKGRHCAEHLRSDDTSMKMRLRDPERLIAPDSGHDAQLQEPDSVILPRLDAYTSCHVVQILQTETSISLLYGEPLKFRFRLPTISNVCVLAKPRPTSTPWETRGCNC